MLSPFLFILQNPFAVALVLVVVVVVVPHSFSHRNLLLIRQSAAKATHGRGRPPAHRLGPFSRAAALRSFLPSFPPSALLFPCSLHRRRHRRQTHSAMPRPRPQLRPRPPSPLVNFEESAAPNPPHNSRCGGRNRDSRPIALLPVIWHSRFMHCRGQPHQDLKSEDDLCRDLWLCILFCPRFADMTYYFCHRSAD